MRAITHVVWAYARLGKYDQALFDTCAEAALPLLHDASPQVSSVYLLVLPHTRRSGCNMSCGICWYAYVPSHPYVHGAF